MVDYIKEDIQIIWSWISQILLVGSFDLDFFPKCKNISSSVQFLKHISFFSQNQAYIDEIEMLLLACCGCHFPHYSICSAVGI